MTSTHLSLPNHTVHWHDHPPDGPDTVGTADTPLGTIRLLARGHTIRAFDLLERHNHLTPAPDNATTDDDLATDILGHVFDDQPHTFHVAPQGTAFQKAVWHELLNIPHGSTATYADIARRLHRTPSAARAVGGAVGANPVAILIPCHRVIGSSNQLTGFGWGLERKETLLRAEGITLF
ncbi:methylated-DNA--[protein]-cysteine S-methyltransferase [Mucisphaera calidilacus]|uniref:methylated-DNA--[protein]-cysteine S-methyltransferase n=1 Tax=Mucisphaera calidilacus TaxID=2527982 RepID=A0A518BWP2_9BACT|nr:methylated-DNA--[protein]-cysteine S-methyltransferase [Mucisphaera calidilacus]QDU71395.1 Methylated-DNA--protein-cysteine methyltransferase [Mucisphaera calidilacus]